VIAARTAAIASYFEADMVEYFTPGDAGGLADAIIALRSDPDRRRQLAKNADAFNHVHDPAATAAAYVSVVDDVRNSREPVGARRIARTGPR
jgi:glycosyltransferase involved in cell wall biosynthesis